MRQLFLSLFIVMTCLCMQAAPIDQTTALQRAKEFLSLHPSGKARHAQQAHPARLSLAKATSHYYIYNVGDTQGFVIVSASDLTAPILGYSDQGAFAEESMPLPMREWLDACAEQMDCIREIPSPAADNVRPAIAPLISTQWGQEAPFSNLCPTDPNNSRTCYTGCIATAMAQIMNYYKWPADSVDALPAYTSSTLQLTLDALHSTHFSWGKMLNNYTDTASELSCSAVAKLMRYCGQAVHMDYTSYNSTADFFVLQAMMTSYFGYDDGMAVRERDNYSSTEWEDIIYRELAARRPVLYVAQKYSGGHQFICDGYKDGLFHINWGWKGTSDGYYLLSVLKPKSESTGAAGGHDGYTFQQSILIGIEPDNNVSDSVQHVLTVKNLKANTTTSSRPSLDADFEPFRVSAEFYNWTGRTNTFDYGFALYQNDSLLQVVATDSVTKRHAVGWAYSKQCTLGRGLTPGVYQLRAVSRRYGSDTWYACEGNGYYQLLLSANGNRLTIDRPAGMQATISGVKVPDHCYINSKTTVYFDVRNTGSTHVVPLYLCHDGDGELKVYSGKCIAVEPGQMVHDSLTFGTPQQPGTYTLQLINDSKVYYNQTITIEPQTTDIRIKVLYTEDGQQQVDLAERSSWGMRTLQSNTLSLDIIATNYGTTEYNGDLIMFFNRQDKASTHMPDTLHLEIASTEVDTMHVEFVDLEFDKTYLFQLQNNGVSGVEQKILMYTMRSRRPIAINAIPQDPLQGNVTITGDILEGESITLTAVPADGFLFDYWEEQGDTVSIEPDYVFAVIEDRTLKAHFISRSEVGLSGDADGDGVLDINDVAAIVAYLQGKTITSFNNDNADVNDDGIIDEKDVAALVHRLVTEDE